LWFKGHFPKASGTMVFFLQQVQWINGKDIFKDWMPIYHPTNNMKAWKEKQSTDPRR